MVFYGSQLGDPQPLNILRTWDGVKIVAFLGDLVAETSDRRQMCGVLNERGVVNLLQRVVVVVEYLP